ncbi:MAG: hypothetical protein RIR39_2475 [Pseudomonadota bacterium]
MKTVLIFGSTGQVGQALLQLALQHPDISCVVAPTRRPLPPHAKLDNPLIDFEALPENAAWWKTDLTLCALGTTLRQAKSKAGFYRVDHDYVLAAAELVRRAGTSTFGFVSSLGADASSRLFYLKVKGETEQALGTLGFVSLVIARPSLLIGGARASARPLEAFGLFVGKHLAYLLPRRYRSITTHQVAKSLLEACLAESAGLHVIESEQLQGAR